MTLEFEKLTGDVRKMADSTQQRWMKRLKLEEQALEKLHRHATDWDRIEVALEQARSRVDVKRLRAARPLNRTEAMDVAIDPPPLPEQATLIAVDGSQILPDRHAAYLYSLINIGGIVYFHGRGRPPHQFTEPVLDYPGRDRQPFEESSAIVNLKRDRAEIESLARAAWDNRHEIKPLVVVLDQRLLYWPVTDAGDSGVVEAWQSAMTAIREAGALLAGFIDRPGKQAVITTLDALDIDEPGFDLSRLTGRDKALGLTDAHLFGTILGPGQRSKVFIDVSHHNDNFREGDPGNQVCFFYLNPGRNGNQVARVDIPVSVATDDQAVETIHALLMDQCRILGDYPYILTRADEIAVVGRRDQENLNIMIERAMEGYGLSRTVTSKQSTKDVARSGKTRHEM